MLGKLTILFTLLVAGCVSVVYKSDAYGKCTDEPQIRNYTDSWTLDDERVYIDAMQHGCKRQYGDGSCLVEFRKLAELEYTAICSGRD